MLKACLGGCGGVHWYSGVGTLVMYSGEYSGPADGDITQVVLMGMVLRWYMGA